MEAINAASQARTEALVEVRGHIIKFDRSLRKFEILKETQLVAYEPPSASVSKVDTRAGGWPKLATVQVDCDTCKGWEVVVLGGEQDIIRKKKDRLFCEHGLLVTELTEKHKSHQPVRPIKQLYRRVEVALPAS